MANCCGNRDIFWFSFFLLFPASGSLNVFIVREKCTRYVFSITIPFGQKDSSVTLACDTWKRAAKRASTVPSVSLAIDVLFIFVIFCFQYRNSLLFDEFTITFVISFLVGLPTTKLGNYLQERVNNYLRNVGADAGEVTIRVVSSSDKVLDTRPG